MKEYHWQWYCNRQLSSAIFIVTVITWKGRPPIGLSFYCLYNILVHWRLKMLEHDSFDSISISGSVEIFHIEGILKIKMDGWIFPMTHGPLVETVYEWCNGVKVHKCIVVLHQYIFMRHKPCLATIMQCSVSATKSETAIKIFIVPIRNLPPPLHFLIWRK